MRKIKYLMAFIICLFVINVKADMGPPVIAEHEVMVTNKDGAICYESGKKTKTIIPYGTTFTIDTDISDGYIYVSYEDKACSLKASDISSKTQKFSLDSKDVEQITPVKAIILSKSGLNMRKGPSVTFSKIMTVPNKAVVTLTHKSGTYWYYAEYEGHEGWITGMDGYFGYDGKEVLYSAEPMKIYSTYDRKAVIGKIPANTEITDYVNLVTRSEYDIAHYVIYNGMTGYVEQMMYKTDVTGKIKLIKDYEVKSETGELIKKLTPQELEYNMVNEYGNFYLTDKKIVAAIPSDYYEYVTKANKSVKTKGYLGEGLFGEIKFEYEEPKEVVEQEEVKEEPKEKEPSSTDTKDIIIICLLGGIFLALTALVIIKIVNSKKNNTVPEISKEE